MKVKRYLPLTILVGMASAFLLVAAVLPLYGLFFYTALLPKWLLFPTHLLFPGQQVTPSLNGIISNVTPPAAALSWWHTGLLLGCFALLLLFYLVALSHLPQRVNRGYIILSTLLLGLICVGIPVVTSQDLFSYIIYARMPVLYHLNPLTATPQAIQFDPVYQHLYWKDQPSAYGPTWIVLSGAMQWLADFFGSTHIAPMVLLLRLAGLLSHLWSALLIWSISGRLPGTTAETRRCAALAFAWNPLLLFEACTNAHNDTIVLLFVMLGIWFLLRAYPTGNSAAPIRWRNALFCVLMWVIATCIKLNVALLVPGLFLLLWGHSRRRSVGLIVIYTVGILALYAPFWQQGTLLDILRINPGVSRDINTLSEFLSQFCNSLLRWAGLGGIPEINSPSEGLLHTLSQVLFVVLYAGNLLLCLLPGRRLDTPARLIRWMAFSWLLYCFVGAPWFWPWYAVTFFGLFALVEANDSSQWRKRSPLAARLLAFSLLSLYCFFTWAPFVAYTPWLPGFRWSFWRGLWAWLIPLLPILAKRRSLYVPRQANRAHETASQ